MSQKQTMVMESKAMKEIVVIDPTSRYGKLAIPMNLTFETKGRAEWIKCNGKLKKDLSICCLFQKGKCHVGERCFQVHIDRSYVIELRKKYAHLTTCCHSCGDVHSDNDAHRRLVRSSFPTGAVAISFGGFDLAVEIKAAHLASTIGLEDALKPQQHQQRDGVVRRRDGTPVFSFSKVCRLHLKNSCKYGKDCKNLHICYKVADQLNQDVEQLPRLDSRTDSRTSAPVTPVQSSLSMDVHYPRLDSEDSLCPTPEVQSRTSTPSMGSPIDACVVNSLMNETLEHINGVAASPTKAHSAGAVSPPSQDLSFLSRFQSQWHCGNRSTESLQIIFGGFPSVL
jgi:hypothetical protein